MYIRPVRRKVSYMAVETTEAVVQELAKANSSPSWAELFECCYQLYTQGNPENRSSAGVDAERELYLYQELFRRRRFDPFRCKRTK
jgi:hypothetical protein